MQLRYGSIDDCVSIKRQNIINLFYRALLILSINYVIQVNSLQKRDELKNFEYTKV